MKKPVKLTPKQKEFLKSLQKDKRQELKLSAGEEYLGFPVLTLHPRNELSKADSRMWGGVMKTAESLLQKKIIKVVSASRDVVSFDEVSK